VFPKIGIPGYPKMDGENNGKTLILKWIIWGENPPIFGNTQEASPTNVPHQEVPSAWSLLLRGCPYISSALKDPRVPPTKT